MSNEEEKTDRAAVVTTTGVLMPGTRLTFHVQDEERRELVERTLLDQDDLLVARTPSGSSEEGLPEVATKAEILDAARPHPSRLVLIAGGEGRVEVVSEEIRDGRVDYREFDAVVPEERAVEVRANDVRGLLARISDYGIELADSVRADLEGAMPSKVADVVGSVAFEEPRRHQELLEEPDVMERLDSVERQLQALLERHAA